MYSTLGYEAISRKKKVAIFAFNKDDNNNKLFGWPAKNKKKYRCFLSKKTELPMMLIDDAIQSAYQLMSAKKSCLSVSSSYNISSFSITPEILKKQILLNGFEIDVEFRPDFRQQIANSWPKKISDIKAKSDWGWKAKYNLEESIRKSLNF